MRVPPVFPDETANPVKDKADKDDIICQQEGRNMEKVWRKKRKSEDKREEAGEDKGKLGQISERSRDKLRVCNESINPEQKIKDKKPFQESIEKSPPPHGRRENPFQERQSLMENVRKNLQQRIFSHIAASLFMDQHRTMQ